MATVTYQQIWTNHPYPDSPCDSTLFVNQCAIRMGVALAAAGVVISGFGGAKCWLKHNPRHILRAQELATWMTTQSLIFGDVTKYTSKMSSADFAGKTGIVFIQDGWGATDHIDVWNGTDLKAGDSSYFARGKQIWFWSL